MNYILIGSLSKGGAERQVSYLAQLDCVKKVFSFSNVNFFNINNHEPILPFLNQLRILQLLLAPFILFFKIKNGDTIISFMEFSNFINILLKFFKNHKAIISVRTNPERYLLTAKGRLIFFTLKHLYNFSDVVVCNSEELKNILTNLGLDKEKILCIPNAIDITKIKQHQTSDFKNKSLIYCGRLVEIKNIHSILNILKVLVRIDNEYTLTIVGDGPLKENLIEQCELLELVNNVTFVGSQKDPFKYFYKGSILLLTSKIEGSPNVLIEAMACGLPVIAGDCRTGPKDIILDNGIYHGRLLNVPMSNNDYVRWATEVQEIYKDSYENYSRLSYCRANEYEVNKIMNKWISVL